MKSKLRKTAEEFARRRGISHLHVIDYEDVNISATAVSSLKRAAGQLLADYAPSAFEERLSPAKAVALFIDRLFWDEATGELLMCSDLAERSFCLPIPKDHWGLRAPAFLQ
jgi:hypothetical protein